MSLLNDASLILVPSAIKTGEVLVQKPLPNKFADETGNYDGNDPQGNANLTFTRASSATRVNSSGLIEKVRTNQALYSEDFTNAYWLKTNATITSNTIANPIDGVVTADSFTPTNVSATNRIRSASISLASAGMSIYVKANGYTKVGIREDATSGYYASYDLSSGTILDSNGVISPTITSLSNGWYRISLGVIAPPASMGVWILDPTYTSGTFNAVNWTADGTSGIYVFGAQIEGGDIATDYIPTTSAAVSVGPVANLPRLDYLGSSCPRLLLEPQRTNVYPYSEQLNQWSSTNPANLTANYAVSPDGYQNADRVQFVSGMLIYMSGTGSAGENTLSVYAKATNGTSAKFRFFANGATTFSSDQTATGEWQRFTFTHTYSAVTAGLARPTTNGGVDDVIFWGFQHEANASYATSYIGPTLGAAVTRLADACSKTGISSLIGQTEGTLFVEFTIENEEITGANRIFSVTDTTANNRILLLSNSTEGMRFYLTSGGVLQFDNTFSSILNGPHKVALGYSGTNLVGYMDGVKLFESSSSYSIPATSAVYLGTVEGGTSGSNLEGSVNQALLFKTRLSNAQLAELTTL